MIHIFVTSAIPPGIFLNCGDQRKASEKFFETLCTLRSLRLIITGCSDMSPQPTVLIVDDEKHTRDGLRRLLENDYDVYVAADVAGAMNVLEREQIDVLLTDLRLGGEDGMVLIDRALKISRPPICIMMTAYGSVDVAVQAMKRGAYDFVTKPLNLDKVELLIARAMQSRKLEQENRALREQVDERYGLENIWG